jgi:hypothetical protein
LEEGNCNCFEEGDRLALDIIELDGPIYAAYEPVPDLFTTAPAGRPVGYRFDLASRALVDRTSISVRDRSRHFRWSIRFIPAFTPASRLNERPLALST